MNTLQSLIRDIIQSEIYLRDVPYSLEEGAQEVDPDSLDDAAKKIQELINVKTLEYLNSFNGPSYKLDEEVYE